MNASDWFKTWVEEVKARETESEVESEGVTEMFQSHDKTLMDKEMRKKKKKTVASWDKIYTCQNKLWKLLKWKQRIKNTI